MNKKVTIITSLIIIIGIIVTLTAGFNVEMLSKKHQEIQLEIGKEFKTEEIKEITNEVFNGQTVAIQKVEVFEDQVLISTKKITDEQKNNLITKINEKYGTEINAEGTTTNTVPKTSLKDYVIPQITPVVIATIIIAIYACIRYKKLSPLKVFVQIVLGIVIAQLLVFSILAITQIPVGSNIPAVILVIYAVSILCLTCMFEKKYQQFKIEENKK